MKDEQKKKIFSISNEFTQVETILNDLPRGTASRYICEAIIEKHERQNNPNSIENQIKTMVTNIVQNGNYQQLALLMNQQNMMNGFPVNNAESPAHHVQITSEEMASSTESINNIDTSIKEEVQDEAIDGVINETIETDNLNTLKETNESTEIPEAETNDSDIEVNIAGKKVEHEVVSTENPKTTKTKGKKVIVKKSDGPFGNQFMNNMP